MGKQGSVSLWALAFLFMAGIVIGAWWRVVFDALVEYWRLPAVVGALALYVWSEWREARSKRKISS